MMTDPAFWESLTSGRVNNCRADATADGVQVALAVKAPVQARRFTGDTLDATLDASWTPTGDTWTGPMGMSVKGLPASFTGSSTISPDGDGTKVAYQGDLTIKIPLVGDKLEAKAAPFLMSVIDSQQAAGAAWLARG